MSRCFDFSPSWFPDMQKFPLRMKDNDLLVTELYHDPSNDAITALSVYLTPKTSQYTHTHTFLYFLCHDLTRKNNVHFFASLHIAV